MNNLTKIILAETPAYLVLNKPSGIIVEQNPFETSLEDWVSAYLQKSERKPFVGIVHRLDRVTSGVIVFAKKKSTLKALQQQFALRKVRKTYQAVVAQKPNKSKALLQHFLAKDPKNKKAIIHLHKFPKAQVCRLRYRIIATKSEQYLLDISPETGKFHQIRAQLSYIGTPIIGDKKYGSSTLPSSKHIALHAKSLQFIAPSSDEPMSYTAPLPNHPLWEKFKHD